MMCSTWTAGPLRIASGLGTRRPPARLENTSLSGRSLSAGIRPTAKIVTPFLGCCSSPVSTSFYLVCVCRGTVDMDALGLLRPAASVSGLPAAHVPHAASGFALGDHAGRAPSAPADGPGVVASASSGPLQRRFEPYQNNGGYVVGHVLPWCWSLCGRGTCRSGWAACTHAFQYRRCEEAPLASFRAVALFRPFWVHPRLVLLVSGPGAPGCPGPVRGLAPTSNSVLTASVLSVYPDCVFACSSLPPFLPPGSGGLVLLPTSGLSRPWSDFAACRTVLAVAGKDFCVVASDTRLGLGYSIPSRKVSRILKMYVLPSDWS